MPGMYKYSMEIESNVKKLLLDTKELQDRMDTLEGKEYKINLNIDEKKLGNVISNLEKMLDSLGKGTGDFKQFENLSKELSSIVSEVQSLSKAFGKVDDSGTKTLLSSIQNIDKSLSELSQNILNVNKNMSNMGGNTSGAVKQVENISDAYQNAAKEAEKLADAQSKIGQKTNISLGDSKEQSTEIDLYHNLEKRKVTYDEIIDKIQTIISLKEKEKSLSKTSDDTKLYQKLYDENDINWAGDTEGTINRISDRLKEIYIKYNGKISLINENDIQEAAYLLDILKGAGESPNLNKSQEKFYQNKKFSNDSLFDNIHVDSQKTGEIDKINTELSETYRWFNQLEGVSLNENIANEIKSLISDMQIGGKNANEYANDLLKIFNIEVGSNSVVEQQNKLQSELKETESQAEKTTMAVKEVSSTASTEQKKDAFPKTSENLEQVAQSEQKVQQEAVATDKALDNISFTPNTEGFEDIITKFGILREQAEQITKIVKTTKQTADGTPNISYKATLKNGSSYYLGENSTPQVLNASETVYDAKADNAKKLEREKQIWNELTTSLERYATIQKRIASNNALSTDNEEAIKLLEHIHELQRNDILPTEKLTASNEKLQQINQTVTDLKEKLKESTLDSLQGSIDKYQKIYDQRKTYSPDFTPSEQYTKNLTALNTAIGNLVEYRNTLKNVSEVTVEQEAELKGLVTACEKASDSFKSLSASEKGASQIAIDKLVQRINKDLDECTNYSKEAKLGLRALRDELESANPRNLKEITSEIINIENAEIKAGRAGRSFFDTLKNSGFHQIAAQMAGMFGVYDVINVIKQAASTVTELNTQITELAKVSEQSSSQIYADFDSYADIAKEVRGTISDTIAATADWSKNGYSIPDAKKLAEVSQLYKNVGDGIDINTANESLISTLKGFQLEADQAEHIVDVFNEVSNNEAISSGGIGEALQRSAASFNAASTSLEKSVSLVTATNSVLQNPEKVGKQILAYLYSNVMKIKVAISVKILRRTRPRKGYNVCFNY